MIDWRMLARCLGAVAALLAAAVYACPSLAAERQYPVLVKKTLTNSDITNLTPYKGYLYFGARYSISGHEVGRTDGVTTSGAIINIDGLTESYPIELTPVGDSLYFTAQHTSDGFGYRPYRSDGTTAGSTLLYDAAWSKKYKVAHGICPVGNLVYFLGESPLGGDDNPWVTDGTVSGTRMVKDFTVRDGFGVANIINVNGVAIVEVNAS